MSLATRAVQAGATVAETLTIARAYGAEATRRERLAAGEETRAIQEYASTVGEVAARHLKEQFPAYLHHPFVPEAAPFGPVLTLQAPTADEAVHALFLLRAPRWPQG